MPIAKILIAEDEAITAKDIELTLKKLGYEISAVVNTGEDAVSLTETLKPDIVLLDIILKGNIDGIEAARLINERTKTPVIYITALQDESTIERSKSTRPYGFLLKPLDERDLNSCLRMAMFRIDTEKKLRESEERYFRLAENARDMIYRYDFSEDRVLYINKAAFDFTGYKPVNFYNDPALIKKIVHSDWLKIFEREIESARQGTASPYLEFKINARNGSAKWVNQSTVLIRNESNKIEVMECILKDITEQKNYEVKLRLQGEEYRLILDSVPAFIWYKDTNNKIIRVNKKAAQLRGMLPEEMEGKFMEEIYPTAAEKNFLYDEKVINSGEPVFGAVEQFETGKENFVWIKSDKFPYRNSKGEIIGVVIFGQDITEIKKTEDAFLTLLQKSEEKYRRLTEYAPVSVTRYIPSLNRNEFVNREFTRQSGYTLEEFDDLNSEELNNMIYIKDRDRIYSAYKDWKLSNHKRILRLDYRIVNKFGRLVWLDTYTYADIDESGTPEAINQICIDVTEEKMNEEKLVESKNQLDAFFTQSIDGFFLAEFDKPLDWNSTVEKDELIEKVLDEIRIVKVNEAFCQQFGVDEKQIMNLTAREYYREDIENAKQRWIDFLNDGKMHVDHEFKKLNGEKIHIEGDYICLYDVNGSITGYFGVQRDVTERKRSEEALKQSEERYKSFIEHSTEGIYRNELLSPISTDLSIDEQVNLLFKFSYIAECNSSMAKMYGYNEPEELTGKRMSEMIVASDPHNIKFVKNFIKNNYTVIDSESHEVDKNGKDVMFLNNAVGIVKDGMLYRVWGTQRDITKLKKAEEKIKQSLQEKELLLKEIHHRVKNNLQIVTSLLKLQTKYVDDQKTIELLQESQDRIQSMSIIHQKLYQSSDLSGIQLNEYLITLISHLKQSYGIGSKPIEVKIHSENILISIDDAIPLGLIVNELVSNAFKHAFKTNLSGEVKVAVYSDKEKYLISVKDTGAGLDENFALQKTSSFGLKLVNTLAEQMKGSVEIIRNGGTEFKVEVKKSDYKERA